MKALTTVAGFGLGPEALALDDQQGEDARADDQRDDVGGVEQVQGERRDEQRHGDQPRAPLAPQDAPREHDHADAGDGRQRPGRLDHRHGQVLRDEVQVLAQRSGHRGEKVDGTRHEEGDRGETSDAADPDVVRRHLGGGRPRRTAGPARHQLRVDVGRLGAALDHGVGRHQALAHRGQRQVGLGQQQAHVEFRPRLDLEGRLLAMMQERGREPEAATVLVHDLGGGSRAGEEPRIEVGQLRHQRPAHDDARGAGFDGDPRGVERVLPVQFELIVRDRPGSRRPTGPRGGQALAPEGAPDAARRDGDHDGQHGEQGHGDHDRDDEAGGPGGVVGPLQRGLLAGRAEHPAQTVDHELDAQQQRDHGQRERRRPEVAAQPPVQHARGDEPARQPRVVQALHAGQPRPVLGRCGVGRPAAGRPEGAGAHQHRPRAGSGLTREVDPVAAPARLARSSACTSAGSRSAGSMTTITWESARAANAPQRVGEVRMRVHDARRIVETARRDQAPADDHDARTLPLLEPAGDVAARGPRAVGGLRGQQEIADHLHPAAERHGEGAVGPGCSGRGSHHPRVVVGSHSSSIVSPSGPPAPPQFGGIALPEGREDPVRLLLRARHQA